jgi:CheY-like chemotaxis protein
MAARLQILLAEDNPVNQRVMTWLLQKLGHAVEVAGAGDRALAALERGGFDLVLMDIQLPGLDGLAAAAAIRAKERAAGGHVPIVALTAQAAKSDRRRCLEAGMDACLSKPVSADELARTIERLFPTAPPSPTAVAPFTTQDSTAAIDEARLWRRYEGDRGLVAQLADLLRQQQPRLMAAAREAAAKEDGKAACEALHGLRGALAHLHANAACDAAQVVERMAARGDWPRFAEAFSTLQDALADCDAALASLLERRPAPTVLTVEDELVSRRVLRRELEKLGYGVAEAEGGAAAWEIFQRGEFPIVISDWMMPEMDGLELVRRIRSVRPRPRVFLILLTANSDEEAAAQAWEAGADELLRKPLDPRALAARLRVAEQAMSSH